MVVRGLFKGSSENGEVKANDHSTDPERVSLGR